MRIRTTIRVGSHEGPGDHPQLPQDDHPQLPQGDHPRLLLGNHPLLPQGDHPRLQGDRPLPQGDHKGRPYRGDKRNTIFVLKPLRP